jgi:hypothetical protein
MVLAHLSGARPSHSLGSMSTKNRPRSRTKPTRTRLSVEITSHAYTLLVGLAEDQGVSLTSVVEQLIRSAAWVQDQARTHQGERVDVSR